jgi:hypothetical protein
VQECERPIPTRCAVLMGPVARVRWGEHRMVQECGLRIPIRCAVLMGPVVRVRWVEHQVPRVL